MRSRFVGVGAALPSRIVPNAEIEDRLGVDRGWIESRTGVRERRVLRSEESLVDLAEAAAREALAAADVAPGALDAVVVATTSGPYLFPSLACLLHERLGLSAQPAFDVAAACAGFPYALSVADQGVRAGDYERVLVVGADRLSAFCEPSDRGTSALFGDGAGAVILAGERGGSEGGDRGPVRGERGILACRLRALGAEWPMLYVRSGARAPGELAADDADFWMRMRGPEVFRLAVEQLVALTREALAAAELAAGDVALLVPHQANVRIIRAMVAQLGIAEERVGINLDRCGNTSAASIPIALRDAASAGRLQAGDVLVLNAVGGGMTAGALVARW
ncbi:MAG TPA: beta-ketoacyl-ACP synthase 3 [Candidatus Binatia bacterium]|nr:beta-ketoacyl-ACP synthase 3 [Candidatus Binatia bacterium]